jgi:hypothetical protein
MKGFEFSIQTDTISVMNIGTSTKKRNEYRNMQLLTEINMQVLLFKQEKQCDYCCSQIHSEATWHMKLQ